MKKNIEMAILELTSGIARFMIAMLQCNIIFVVSITIVHSVIFGITKYHSI